MGTLARLYAMMPQKSASVNRTARQTWQLVIKYVPALPREQLNSGV